MWRYRLPGYELRLLEELQRQKHNSLYCDTLLQTDGLSVPAHSCILAALSPYLSKALSKQSSPLPAGQRWPLKLQAVKAQTLLKLVDLLYSGELEGEGTMEQEEVMAAACKLGIGRLVEGWKDRRRDGEEERRCSLRDVGVQTEGGETQVNVGAFVETGTQTVDCNGGIYMTFLSPLPDALAISTPSPSPPHPPLLLVQSSSDGQQHTTHTAPPSLSLQIMTPTSHPSSTPPSVKAMVNCGTAPPTSKAEVTKLLSSSVVLSGDMVAPSDDSDHPTTPREKSAVPECSVAENGVTERRIEKKREQQQLTPHTGRAEEGGTGECLERRGVVGRKCLTRQRLENTQISIKVKLRRRTRGQVWELVSGQETNGTISPGQRQETDGTISPGQRQETDGTISPGQRQLVLAALKKETDRMRTRQLPRQPLPPPESPALPRCSPLDTAFLTPPPDLHISPPPRSRPHPTSKTTTAQSTSLNHCSSTHHPTPHPAHEPQLALPQPPVEESDEQIEKMLEDIMMGLNILPPVVLDRDCNHRHHLQSHDRPSACSCSHHPIHARHCGMHSAVGSASRCVCSHGYATGSDDALSTETGVLQCSSENARNNQELQNRNSKSLVVGCSGSIIPVHSGPSPRPPHYHQSLPQSQASLLYTGEEDRDPGCWKGSSAQMGVPSTYREHVCNLSSADCLSTNGDTTPSQVNGGTTPSHVNGEAIPSQSPSQASTNQEVPQEEEPMAVTPAFLPHSKTDASEHPACPPDASLGRGLRFPELLSRGSETQLSQSLPPHWEELRLPKCLSPLNSPEPSPPSPAKRFLKSPFRYPVTPLHRIPQLSKLPPWLCRTPRRLQFPLSSMINSPRSPGNLCESKKCLGLPWESNNNSEQMTDGQDRARISNNVRLTGKEEERKRKKVATTTMGRRLEKPKVKRREGDETWKPHSNRKRICVRRKEGLEPEQGRRIEKPKAKTERIQEDETWSQSRNRKRIHVRITEGLKAEQEQSEDSETPEPPRKKRKRNVSTKREDSPLVSTERVKLNDGTKTENGQVKISLCSVSLSTNNVLASERLGRYFSNTSTKSLSSLGEEANGPPEGTKMLGREMGNPVRVLRARNQDVKCPPNVWTSTRSCSPVKLHQEYKQSNMSSETPNPSFSRFQALANAVGLLQIPPTPPPKRKRGRPRKIRPGKQQAGGLFPTSAMTTAIHDTEAVEHKKEKGGEPQGKEKGKPQGKDRGGGEPQGKDRGGGEPQGKGKGELQRKGKGGGEPRGKDKGGGEPRGKGGGEPRGKDRGGPQGKERGELQRKGKGGGEPRGKGGGEPRGKDRGGGPRGKGGEPRGKDRGGGEPQGKERGELQRKGKGGGEPRGKGGGEPRGKGGEPQVKEKGGEPQEKDDKRKKCRKKVRLREGHGKRERAELFQRLPVLSKSKTVAQKPSSQTTSPSTHEEQVPSNCSGIGTGTILQPQPSGQPQNSSPERSGETESDRDQLRPPAVKLTPSKGRAPTVSLKKFQELLRHRHQKTRKSAKSKETKEKESETEGQKQSEGKLLTPNESNSSQNESRLMNKNKSSSQSLASKSAIRPTVENYDQTNRTEGDHPEEKDGGHNSSTCGQETEYQDLIYKETERENVEDREHFENTNILAGENVDASGDFFELREELATLSMLSMTRTKEMVDPQRTDKGNKEGRDLVTKENRERETDLSTETNKKTEKGKGSVVEAYRRSVIIQEVEDKMEDGYLEMEISSEELDVVDEVHQTLGYARTEEVSGEEEIDVEEMGPTMYPDAAWQEVLGAREVDQASSTMASFRGITYNHIHLPPKIKMATAAPEMADVSIPTPLEAEPSTLTSSRRVTTGSTGSWETEEEEEVEVDVLEWSPDVRPRVWGAGLEQGVTELTEEDEIDVMGEETD